MQKVFEIRMGTGHKGEKPVEMTAETLEKVFEIVSENPGKRFSINYGKKFIYVRITADENGKFHSVYWQGCSCCNPRPITNGRFFKKYIVIRPDGKTRVNEIWRNVRKFWLESTEIDGTVFAYGQEIIRAENARRFHDKKDSLIFARNVGRDKGTLRKYIGVIENPNIGDSIQTVTIGDITREVDLWDCIDEITGPMDEGKTVQFGCYNGIGRKGKCGYDFHVSRWDLEKVRPFIIKVSDYDLVFVHISQGFPRISFQVWRGQVANVFFNGVWYHVDRTKKKMDFVEIPQKKSS